MLKKAGDRAAWLLLRAAWALLRSAGPKASRRALEGIGGALMILDRRHRAVVEDNLAIAFPQMDRVVRDSVVTASFRNWGRIGAEAVDCDALIGAAREDPAWKSVAAAVAEGLAQGRGLLLLTAHIGNFELLARIFGSTVAPVAVFHRSLGIVEIDRFLIEERRRCGVATLGRGAAVRDALRILGAGGCVAVPLDQNQRQGRGIFVDVLGQQACTSTMLARLSMTSSAPVLPVFAIWNDGGTSPFIGELIGAPPRQPPGTRDLVLRSLTERYAAEIDRVVRRFPHQWNWAHRRWKTRPPGVEPAL
ncbi:MAG TPA: hypothetical protein VGK20_16030 [Candidatus Binatia bacterium]|jgi:KDO2-lipid IV(A) lauroyltransferase